MSDRSARCSPPAPASLPVTRRRAWPRTRGHPAARAAARPPPPRRRRCRRRASRRRRARRRAGAPARAPTICMKPAFTRFGKRACRSIAGPSVATGASSTSDTASTACGLPIETAPISSVRPATSRDSCRPRPAPRTAANADRSPAPPCPPIHAAVGDAGAHQAGGAVEGDGAVAGQCRGDAGARRCSAHRCRTARPRRRRH